MLGEASKRPSASEVVAAARAIRDSIGTLDRVDVERVIDALTDEAEPEIVIVYSEPEPEPAPEPEEDVVLLESRRVALDTVIVDLEACG